VLSELTTLQRLAILLVLWFLLQGGGGSSALTAAVYIHEKDDTPVPSAVRAAISQLNSQGLLATEYEEDTTDGTDDVPAQYKLPLEAAKKAGLPAMVFLAKDKVAKVLKDPKTDTEILEAVK
jgi:hypothetical protein